MEVAAMVSGFVLAGLVVLVAVFVALAWWAQPCCKLTGFSFGDFVVCLHGRAWERLPGGWRRVTRRRFLRAAASPDLDTEWQELKPRG